MLHHVLQISRGILIADPPISLSCNKRHIGDLVRLPGFVATLLEQRLRDHVMPLDVVKLALMGEGQAEAAVPVLRAICL